MMRRAFALLIGIPLFAMTSLAQGTISAQGLGYPLGQTSAKALGMGGALGEFDPQSVLNPAALAGWGRAALYVSYQPEYRSVAVAGGSDHATVMRFPLFATATSIRERATLGFSFSTLLDRTWTTISNGSRVVGSDTVPTREDFGSRGAINDLRGALSYALNGSLSVGVGLHAFTGQNRLNVKTVFTSAGFDSLVEASALAFSGTGVSGGADWHPSDKFGLAVSARRGGAIRAYSGDTVKARASIPNRLGVGARFNGIAGLTLAASAAWEGWSSFAGMAAPTGSSLSAFDTKSFSFGADAKGPRLASRVIMLRSGAQWRTLPFGSLGSQIKELNLGFGAGAPLAGGRATFDLSLVHAARSFGDTPRLDCGIRACLLPGPDVQERAWTFGMGLTVRP